MAEVDPRFEIYRDAVAVSKTPKKLTLNRFWSDRFETKRTWAPIWYIYRYIYRFDSFQSDRTKNDKVLNFLDTSDFW